MIYIKFEPKEVIENASMQDIRSDDCSYPIESSLSIGKTSFVSNIMASL